MKEHRKYRGSGFFRRTTAAAMALCLSLSSLPISGLAADAKGYSRTDTLAHGLTLYQEQTRTAEGRGGKTYIYDYTPGEKTGVLVAYGDALYGKSDVNTVVDYAEGQGHTVMAAFNADFFSMATGIPTGLVVREGRLISSDGAWNAIGFREDGTAIIGTPKLDITFAVGGGQRFRVAGFNKVRDDSGAFLYSRDYGSSTYLTAEGPSVLLRKVDSEDDLTIGGSITLEVIEAGMVKGATALSEDTFVLTHQAGQEIGIDLTALQRGELVTIYTGVRSEGWEDVRYACGGGDLLVQDGVLTAEATASSGRSPRTMVGIRRDGSMAILVCDGRNSGISDGLTLAEGARRLLDEGCRTVINLDGGGSSVASARYPGYEGSTIISDPSDGSPRECATYILFTNEGKPNSSEYGVAVYPRDALVLAGGPVRLEAKSYNRDYFPVESYDSGFTIRQGDGEIDGDLLTTPSYGTEITVSLRGAGRCEEGVITAIDEPATLSVVKKGASTALNKMAIDGGDSVDLDVIVTDGLRTIASTDEQFTFEVGGNIGTIDESGRFTAEDVQGRSGTITVSYGDISHTLSVTVGHAPQVITGFEGERDFTPSNVNGGMSSVKVNLTADSARYGMGSLEIAAQAPADVADTALYTARNPMKIAAGMQQLTLTAKGEGRWYIDFNTDSGVVSLPMELHSGGWTLNTIDLPAGVQAIAGFRAEMEAGGRAAAWLDQIVGHYGKAQPDEAAPTIDLIADGENFILSVYDDGAYALEASNLTVKLDGAVAADAVFDEDTGLLTLPIPQDGLLHKLTVEAVDYFGNRSRFVAESQGELTGPFGDLSGHWAETYVNYLHGKGVFSADTAFRPQSSCTNEMVATMISRYMGIDTSRYEAVELPYADLEKVHDWALPHVKALYALGIMQGGSDSSGNIWFYPTDGANRARVMTVLGRTIARGYAYAGGSFSDWNSVPAWAKEHIALLSHLGIVNGYGGGNEVKANAGITRAEVAALLYRLY